jgi:hypothetical protein
MTATNGEEAAQAEDGEDVARVDDERVLRHPEHRGDAVHREHHVESSMTHRHRSKGVAILIISPVFVVRTT